MTYRQIAILAVKEAGKIIMNYLGKIKTITEKSKRDYVTNVDIQSENKIKEIIKSHFPDHSMVAEESEVEKRNTNYTWFIDPLSSTANYIHGLPHFAVVVCLQKERNFVVSAVYDPFYDELFVGERAKGVSLNNKTINVSRISNLSDALVFAMLDWRDSAVYIQKIVSQFGDIRRVGSTALQLCYVACGRGEAHIDNYSDIFSIPGGMLILEEAGGKVSDFKGKAWNTSSPTILASNGKIHDKLITTLRDES